MKILVLGLLIIVSVACGKDDEVSTISNATWILEKITFTIDESEEYELLDAPDVKIDIQDNTFSYSDNGTKLSGSWNLDLAAMLLTVTNPNGDVLVFPFVSLSNDSWKFVANTIDLTRSEFNEGEDAALDMINRKFIELDKDFETEISGKKSLKVMFVMKKNS